MSEKNEMVSVLIPVYNEDEKILNDIIISLKKIFEPGSDKNYEIIVIDDGSKPPINKTLIRDLGVKLLVHEKNMGYGASLKLGLRTAQGEKIVIIDADGTYPVDAVPELLKSLEDADMTVGARTGKIVEIPFARQPAKYVLRKVADYLAGQKIPDLNSGLRAFKKSAAMQFIHLFPQGFSFTTTLTLALISDGYVVKYIPINYYKRESSKSKIRPIADTKNILLTILRTVIYFEPLKICLPVGFIFMFFALLILILTLTLQISGIIHNIPDGTISVMMLTGIQIMVIGLLADLIIRRSGK